MTSIVKKYLQNVFKSFVARVEDFLIFTGVAIVLYNTYQHFGQTVGNYVLGGVFLFFGLAIAKR